MRQRKVKRKVIVSNKEKVRRGARCLFDLFKMDGLVISTNTKHLTTMVPWLLMLLLCHLYSNQTSY